MTNGQITDKFRRAIDQFFEFRKHNEKYVEESKVLFIGGMLQGALHVLPWEDYYSLKVYCYEQWKYDPGGVTTGQMNLQEYAGKGDG